MMVVGFILLQSLGLSSAEEPQAAEQTDLRPLLGLSREDAREAVVEWFKQHGLMQGFGLGAGEDMHYVETYKGELINAKGHKARYVRLYSNGNVLNDLNHYIEVEVFGKPVD